MMKAVSVAGGTGGHVYSRPFVQNYNRQFALNAMFGLFGFCNSVLCVATLMLSLLLPTLPLIRLRGRPHARPNLDIDHNLTKTPSLKIRVELDPTLLEGHCDC